ncbi:MAG: glycoside hydrolase family 9 protein [Lachnospiraceae bacterium]|nr:glycoside hydrolase family 9 protein [Lachnospiraceae bacterium]
MYKKSRLRKIQAVACVTAAALLLGACAAPAGTAPAAQSSADAAVEAAEGAATEAASAAEAGAAESTAAENEAGAAAETAAAGTAGAAQSTQTTQEKEENDMSGIRVNQVGYLPESAKTAVFADLPETDATFAVVNAETGEEVFSGDVKGDGSVNPASGEVNATGDFSGVTEPGRYKITTPSGTESYELSIGDDAYGKLTEDTFKMLHLQRCGTELDEAVAGRFAHPACHMDPAIIYGTEEKIDVSGGWHDAGDYGKYIVPGAKAAADLMLAYEANPASTEYLEETAWELDWMLKMQNAEGGVYHKVTGKNFPGFIMPQMETTQWYVCPVSETATADFAAVMAMAARIYGQQDDETMKASAQKYEEAAIRAFAYLEQNGEGKGFYNPEDIVTGEYPDDETEDEYLFAAAALYRLTGDTKYLETVEKYLGRYDYLGDDAGHGLGWVNMAMYAVFELIGSEKLLGDAPQLMQKASKILADAAARIRDNSAKDPYGIDKGTEFEWGSNLSVANAGMVLMKAHELAPGEGFKDAAQRQLDYLLGANPMNICYVTGEGTAPMQHPHHRPSQARGEAVPGMLSGGPNTGLQDPVAASVLQGMPPAKCFVDNDGSYSTNEVAIYWNSPLVCLLKMICK